MGQGEAEVLALACEEKKPLVIIDDEIARKIAKLQGIKLTGTAGVLLKAKTNNYIPEIKPVLEKLREVGFYLSDRVIAEVLKISGEG